MSFTFLNIYFFLIFNLKIHLDHFGNEILEKIYKINKRIIPSSKLCENVTMTLMRSSRFFFQQKCFLLQMLHLCTQIVTLCYLQIHQSFEKNFKHFFKYT